MCVPAYYTTLKPGSHMPAVCLRNDRRQDLRLFIVYVNNRSPVTQVICVNIGGLPGKLTRVQLSRQVCDMSAVYGGNYIYVNGPPVCLNDLSNPTMHRSDVDNMADEIAKRTIQSTEMDENNNSDTHEVFETVKNKALMDTIRIYRAIYDKSCPDYKNQRIKQNAWQAVAEALELDVASVQKRYNTIRTNFSKYIKNIKGKSGSGRADIEIRPDLEHLRWLITHI